MCCWMPGMRRCVRRARCVPGQCRLPSGLTARVGVRCWRRKWRTGNSEGSWTEFLSHLKGRGLRGVEYVVSDSHEGLKHAISKVLPTALWQRCCVHFLRNARDKLSRSADPACLEGLKRLWGCEHVGEAREALGAWVARWGDEKGFGRLVEWAAIPRIAPTPL